MAIRMRRGLESELDIYKAVPGEWLVSTDTRYVRMCFAPGVVLRMATYEAFEADTNKFMQQMEKILSETKTVQEAVQRIQREIEGSVVTVENYIESAKGYSDLSNTYAMQSKIYSEESNNYADDAYNEAERAKMYAENASAVTGVQIATQGTAGIIKGGDNYIGEDGTLQLTTQTTEKTLHNSYAGGIKINSISGASEQDSTTGKNKLKLTAETQTLNGGTFTFSSDGSVTVSGTFTADTTLRIGTADTAMEDDTAFILSGCPSGGSDSTYYLQASSVQGNFVSYGAETEFQPYSVSYAYIVVKGGTTLSNVVFYPMVSLEGGAFEKHTGNAPSPSPDYPQEVESVVVSEIKSNTGQWFDANSLIASSDSSLRISEDTATITVADKVAFGGAFCYIPNLKFIKGQTMTISYESCSISIKTAPVSLQVKMTLADGTTKYIDLNITVKSKTFEVPKDIKTLTVRIITNNAGTDLEVENTVVYKGIMLNIGDTVLPWKPYQESTITLSEPIKLHGIGDVKDRIVQKDDVWGVERKFAMLNVAEATVVEWGTGGGGHDFYIKVEKWDNGANVGRILNALCTHFAFDSGTTLSINAFNFKTISDSGWQGMSRICFRVPYEISTVDAFKEYVGSDCYVLYQKKEPTFEPLPTADQIALHSLKSFSGTTYVYIDSDIEPGTDLEYGTSRVGGYTLKAWNKEENNRLKIEELTTAMLVMNQE